MQNADEAPEPQEILIAVLRAPLHAGVQRELLLQFGMRCGCQQFLHLAYVGSDGRCVAATARAVMINDQ